MTPETEGRNEAIDKLIDIISKIGDNHDHDRPGQLFDSTNCRECLRKIRLEIEKAFSKKDTQIEVLKNELNRFRRSFCDVHFKFDDGKTLCIDCQHIILEGKFSFLESELSTLKLMEKKLVEALEYFKGHGLTDESRQAVEQALSQSPVSLKAEGEAVEKVVEASENFIYPKADLRRKHNNEDIFNGAFEDLATALSNIQKVREKVE